MENQPEDSIPCQNIAGKIVPTRWVDVLRTGNFYMINESDCWVITSRKGKNIISFISEEEMKEWESKLILWRTYLKTKSIQNLSSNTGKKKKPKSKRPKNAGILRNDITKATVRNNFINTEAYKRMQNDTDYWREQP